MKLTESIIEGVVLFLALLVLVFPQVIRKCLLEMRDWVVE